MAQHKFDAIFGTSAATGEGLNEALEILCKKILDKVQTKTTTVSKPT